MHSIAFVIPYFGRLPEYFHLWLASCAWNPTVDFYVFTDDPRTFPCPSNVHMKAMTFEEAKALLQKPFEFPISLSRPYKLCDYKPVYGAAFSAWIGDYDFWGHCDVDLIWGNIRHFFTEERMEQYDRLLWQGHCSIYRNCEEMNLAFKTLAPMGCQDWKTVYSSEENCSFDEYAEHRGGGLSLIMERNGVRMYKEWVFADLCIGLDRFQCAYTENAFYTTDADSRACFFECGPEGIALHYRKYGELRRREMMYVHFQKRRPQLPSGFRCDGTDRFLFLPPGRVVPRAEVLTDRAAAICLRRNDRRLLRSGLWRGSVPGILFTRVQKKLRRAKM